MTLFAMGKTVVVDWETVVFFLLFLELSAHGTAVALGGLCPRCAMRVSCLTGQQPQQQSTAGHIGARMPLLLSSFTIEKSPGPDIYKRRH
ncbi:hypothetical protein QBC37DRAFT_171933 [Rhypophila decipiens]|uniref:Uncharacterized protein n=1 Tax=Rhypophila decipiens TaxID=261697 RepID=A0AAN7B7T2_9PEZI|nr:hypothetical protein QBC37DRAFT_171933 [Rhypophila decipiens]